MGVGSSACADAVLWWLQNKNKEEIRQIKQKLSHMEASAGRLDHLKQELKNTVGWVHRKGIGYVNRICFKWNQLSDGEV